MEPIVFLKPPKIDPAVWRPDIPLVVLEYCESKEQLCVWIAVRWLMAAFPLEKGFGTRKIAARAKVNQKYVTRWCGELVELGLMEKAGEESVVGFSQPRPIYTIPLRQLEQRSSAMAVDVLLRWGAALPPPPPPAAQLQFDLPPTDPLRDQSTDPLRDQTDPLGDQSTDPLRDQTDPLGDQSTDPLRDQTDPLGDQSTDPLRDHRRRKEEGGKEEDRAHARDGALVSFRVRTIPPPPANEAELPAHPIVLWGDIVPDSDTLVLRQLALLASEHNATTDGYGLYWLGRAILAASFSPGMRAPMSMVKAILDRWRATHSYGSDTPAYERRKARTDERQRPPRTNPADSGRNGPGRADGGEDRERTAGAGAAAAAPDGTDRPERSPAPAPARRRAPQPGDIDYYD